MKLLQVTGEQNNQDKRVKHMIYVISNETGRATYKPDMLRLSALVGEPRKPHTPPTPDEGSTLGSPVPKCTPHKLRALLTDPNTPNWNLDDDSRLAPKKGRHYWALAQESTSEDEGPEMTIYTDGSRIDSNVEGGPGKAIGAAAAVHTKSGERRVILINPRGQGATNTINRAELSAIHQALIVANKDRPQSVAIYTDSLCSIYAIHATMHNPTHNWKKAQQAILAEIQAKLIELACAGVEVHIRKVKSHIGITGNEEADEAAGRAAQAVSEGVVLDGMVEEQTDPVAFNGVVWPIKKPQGTEDERHFMANLNEAIKLEVNYTCEQKYTGSRGGLYAEGWRSMAKDIHPASGAVWKSSSVAWKELAVSAKYKWGTLWNTKRAHMCKMLYRGKPVILTKEGHAACPLCGMADSGTHIMGGCGATQEMQALYVKRHDEAVKLIQKAISTGTHGGFAMLMDAGRRTDLPADVCGKAVDLRNWLCKLAPIKLADAVHGQDGVWVSRSDIVILPGIRTSKLQRMLADGKRLQKGQAIHLIEVGMAAEWTAADRMKDKHAQHAQLVRILTRAGFKVHFTVEKHCVVVGHGGTVFKGVANLMQDLGVKQSSSGTLIKDLAENAVKYGWAIINTRRRLECGTHAISVG
jgi:ribonuclease HI